MLIKSIKARKIKDSRNDSTIEISINGQRASSPSGKSTGKYETHSYYKNIDWNVKVVNSLKIPFEIKTFQDLKKLEIYIQKIFKLKSAKEFGANALFALESAILKALAKSKNKELWQIINPKAKKIPIPIGNAIGGGLHSHNKNAPEFQEFLLIPNKKNIKENIKIMKKIHKKLKTILKSQEKNDEGAWQTNLGNEQILEILKKFKNIKIGIDIASSTLYENDSYYYKNKILNKKAQVYYINYLIKKYNVFYMEDPLEENDFFDFNKVIKKNLVVGDDLTATQIPRLKRAIANKSINAMIIKPNQNGSLVELQEIFKICKKNNIKTILSHRSGETLDDALADYAVAFQADFIKTGIATPWREVKLKRLIEIEKSLDK